MSDISVFIYSEFLDSVVHSWKGNFNDIRDSVVVGLNYDWNLISKEYPMIDAVHPYEETHLNKMQVSYLAREINKARDGKLIESGIVDNFMHFIEKIKDKEIVSFHGD